jgi:hypothetical protein
MRKGWRRQRVLPQQRGGRLELQSEDLLGGVFHNEVEVNQQRPMHQLRGRWSRFGMNQKHILPCPKLLDFSASSLPQMFSLLPTSPLPPISPDFAFTPSPHLGSCWNRSRTSKQLEWEKSSGAVHARAKPQQHAWSGPMNSIILALIVGALKRLKWNPSGTKSESLTVSSLP